MEHGLACKTYFTEVSWYGPAWELGYQTEHSTAVVTGKVVEVGSGAWATADGEVPLDEDGDFMPIFANVHHLIKVELSGVGKHPEGDDRFQVGASIDVRTLGGTVGCLTFRPLFDFAVGDKVALFLGEWSAFPTYGDMDLNFGWPIIDGTVTGRDQSLTVEELLELGGG